MRDPTPPTTRPAGRIAGVQQGNPREGTPPLVGSQQGNPPEGAPSLVGAHRGKALKRTPSGDQRQALAELVRQSRLAVSLSVEAAADRANVSHVTWAKVEAAEPVRDMTYAKVEKVLGWSSGAIQQFFGRGTVPRASAPHIPQFASPKEEPSAMDSMLVAVAPPEASTAIEIILQSDLPAPEKVAWIERIRLDMEEAERQRAVRARQIVEMWNRAQGA